MGNPAGRRICLAMEAQVQRPSHVELNRHMMEGEKRKDLL